MLGQHCQLPEFLFDWSSLFQWTFIETDWLSQWNLSSPCILDEDLPKLLIFDCDNFRKFTAMKIKYHIYFDFFPQTFTGLSLAFTFTCVEQDSQNWGDLFLIFIIFSLCFIEIWNLLMYLKRGDTRQGCQFSNKQ